MPVYVLPNGYHGVIEPRPSGVGPVVYFGEVRDAQDRPVAEVMNPVPGQGHRAWPASFSASPARVLDALTARAERLPPC